MGCGLRFAPSVTPVCKHDWCAIRNRDRFVVSAIETTILFPNPYCTCLFLISNTILLDLVNYCIHNNRVQIKKFRGNTKNLKNRKFLTDFRRQSVRSSATQQFVFICAPPIRPIQLSKPALLLCIIRNPLIYVNFKEHKYSRYFSEQNFDITNISLITNHNYTFYRTPKNKVYILKNLVHPNLFNWIIKNLSHDFVYKKISFF